MRFAGRLIAILALLTAGAVPAHAESLAGTLLDTELYSPIMGRTLPYRIYVPPDYFTTSRRYPVLYMLHGAGGNYTEWSDSYLPEQVDRLILSGSVQPMIVVMPEGGGRSYWANWDQGGPRWTDYLTYDVVGDVDTRFRTLAGPASRAVGGLSMGGWGALHIAMRHPDVFGVVGAHSPSVRPVPDEELWFLTGENWNAHSPSWLARNAPGVERIAYWIDVGDQDWWRQNIEEVRDAMWYAGLRINWHVFPGTHEAEYWIEHVPDYLHFYSDNLRPAV